jgi:DNA-binding SARP family transcriptional activator
MEPSFMARSTNLLHIALLGQFRLLWGETAVFHLDTPSHQALLAYLVLHAGQSHSRQHLAFTFWPDSSEDQARTNLRKAIHHLRHTLPQAGQSLCVDRYALTWCGDAPCTLDVTEFATAVSQAQQATTPGERRHWLETAIDRYQGNLLPGHYGDWILAQREALRQQYLACLTWHIQLLEETQEYATAAISARRLLQADPLHETAYRRLMRLQALSGDRAGALHTYRVCATALERELHVLPSTPTEEAYHRLLRPEIAPDGRATLRLPLVGRAQAWSALQTVWKRAARERPLFVLIRGEGGIGKTRLAEELLHWAARQGIPALRSAGHAPTHSLPYGPLADLIRGTAVYKPLNEMDDARLREIGRLLPELLSQRPDLIHPCPPGKSWQQERFFTALAHPILRLHQSFLLFIDDLQWCDVATLEWLCFLLHSEPQARFLLVGAIRDEAVGYAHPLSRLCCDLQRSDRFVQIELGRLTPAETATMAGHVTGCTLTEAQTADLFSETEGVPLFVVEMAEPITANESWITHDEAWPPERLPAKVQALLDERLAVLSPTARDLLALAATIGRSFPFDLLVDASNLPETMLTPALDELCRHRILLEQGADGYTFSHNKLRQMAYASLSQARRRLLRRQVDEALVRQHTPAALTF